jgi:hypothetical protein
MVHVDPKHAPDYQHRYEGGPLNGVTFRWPNRPVEGQRRHDYVYRGRRGDPGKTNKHGKVKRPPSGEYIFEYAPEPEPVPAAPAQTPARRPEPDPPGVADAKHVIAAYCYNRQEGDVLGACHWLATQHPDHAAREAEHLESMRVSMLCDNDHLSSLITQEERQSNWDYAWHCQRVIDMLADAGTFRPEPALCSVHGRAVSAGPG